MKKILKNLNLKNVNRKIKKQPVSTYFCEFLKTHFSLWVYIYPCKYGPFVFKSCRVQFSNSIFAAINHKTSFLNKLLFSSKIGKNRSKGINKPNILIYIVCLFICKSDHSSGTS